MDRIEAEEILAISTDSIAAFVRDQAGHRRLSPLVKKLNADLMGPDPAASEMADRALRHLGFLVRA